MTDWGALFRLDKPLLEIFVRGSVLYLGIFVLMRVVLKRQAGSVGMTDLLVVVLLADASQNAMAGEYHSITSGLLLVATILFWSMVLDWLAFRFSTVRRFVEPPPLPLVKDGKPLRHNMRKELITRDELMALLREHDVDDIGDVESAQLEGTGKLSVVTKEKR
jgi:uncharacterized membrane protein YcaP (DUF421 family)